MAEATCTIEVLLAEGQAGGIQAWLSACGNELGIWGSVASIVSFAMDFTSLIFSVFAFVIGPMLIKRRNKNQYQAEVDYYRNIPHPDDFPDVSELAPESRAEQRTKQRHAEAVYNELKAYTSKQAIKRYESALNKALAGIQRFFKEPEWNMEDIKAARQLANSDDNSSLKTPSITEKSRDFWQLQKTLFSRLSSEGSYKFCLALAFGYPLIFAMVNGLITNEVNLAGLPLFNFETPQSKWMLGVGFLLIAGGGWL